MAHLPMCYIVNTFRARVIVLGDFLLEHESIIVLIFQIEWFIE